MRSENRCVRGDPGPAIGRQSRCVADVSVCRLLPIETGTHSSRSRSIVLCALALDVLTFHRLLDLRAREPDVQQHPVA
jgi:hypothetical protein